MRFHATRRALGCTLRGVVLHRALRASGPTLGIRVVLKGTHGGKGGKGTDVVRVMRVTGW